VTHVAGICLEVSGKIAKNFSEYIWSSDTDLNPGPPKYDSGGYMYIVAFGITVIPIWKAVHL